MAKPDGRVEAGQSLKRAISAQRWNDLCDAADIVHGRRGGVTAGMPAAKDANYIVAKATTGIRPGTWVFLTPGQSEIAVATASDTAGRSQMFSHPVALNASLDRPSGFTHLLCGMAVEGAKAGKFFRVQVSGSVFTFVAMRHRYHGYARFTDYRNSQGDDYKVFPRGDGLYSPNIIPVSALSGTMRIVWYDDTAYNGPATNADAAICPAIVTL